MGKIRTELIPKIKMKLIKWIANGEPVLLNWNINVTLVKNGKFAVYYPPPNKLYEEEELTKKAVLTSIRNVRTNTPHKYRHMRINMIWGRAQIKKEMNNGTSRKATESANGKSIKEVS